MPESQLVKYSEQKSQDYLTDKTRTANRWPCVLGFNYHHIHKKAATTFA